MVKNANTQASKAPGDGKYDPRVNLPVDKQFGKPNGNPQGRGFWRREDTPRYKLERMIKMTEAELRGIADDTEVPFFERKLAVCIARAQWDTLQGMINQVYGSPKQQVEQINKTPQKIKIEVLKPKKGAKSD